jgi:hypothetical protein
VRRDMIALVLAYETYWPRKLKKRPTRKMVEFLGGAPTVEKLEFVLADLSTRLERLDRYERRASSRRKGAMRAFIRSRGCRSSAASSAA